MVSPSTCSQWPYSRRHLAAGILVGGFTFSIFAAISFVFGEILLVLLGCVFALLTTTLFFKIGEIGGFFKVSREIRFTFSAPFYLPYLVYAACICLINFIPSFPSLPSNIIEIPLMSYTRVIASLILTLFLPGFVIVGFIDPCKELSLLERALLSYLLSMFATATIGFAIMVLNQVILIVAPIGQQVFVGVLLFAHLIRFRRQKPTSTGNGITINSLDLSIFFVVILLELVSSIILLLHYFPLTFEDVRRHHLLATTLLNEVVSTLESPWEMQGYPYFFHLFLAVYFSLSGIASQPSYQLLYLLNPVVILAFYACMNAWFKGHELKMIPILATCFLGLMGFGSLVAIYIRMLDPALTTFQVLWTASGKSFDIWLRATYLPDIPSPSALMTAPSLFLFLLFLRKPVSQKIRMAGFGLCHLIIYLSHIVEGVTFLSVVLFYIVIFNEKQKSMYLVLPGNFALAALIEWLSPIPTYLASPYFNQRSLPSFLAGIALSMLILFVLMIKDRSPGQLVWTHTKKIVVKILNYSIAIRVIVLGLYILAWFVWIQEYPSFFGSFQAHYVPWFVEPMRFGFVGLMTVMAIFFWHKELKRDRIVSFFLAMAFIGFLWTTIDNFFELYLPHRHATMILMGLQIVSAWFVSKQAVHIRQTTDDRLQKLFFTGIIVLYIVGVLTTSFYVLLWYYLGG
ncbi:MAG: hypothetical protein ACTSW4_02800 [Candidatus Ranarchaeia archaeon]